MPSKRGYTEQISFLCICLLLSKRPASILFNYWLLRRLVQYTEPRLVRARTLRLHMSNLFLYSSRIPLNKQVCWDWLVFCFNQSHCRMLACSS